mgnify:CR=1 FL=1
MKKIILILITLCLLFAIALPCLAFADEIPDEQPPAEEPETEESETVEVDAELWNEIVAMLEKIKEAENPDAVEQIVYETFFTRLTAWFGEQANTIILILQVLFILVWTLINKNSKFKLKNGINAAYNKTLEIYDSDTEIKNKIDEIAANIKGSQLTDQDRKKISAAVELMWTMLNNSSAIPTVKAEGKQIYDEANR